MKSKLTDANFPTTADGRVYHLGFRAGEVANRIVTVGSPSRAATLASLLDASPPPFKLETERGFLTITGRYASVPVSIVSIGMGAPNCDFFTPYREARECISGDMIVIRLGSCGSLTDLPVGSLVVPRASVAVARNYDFNFLAPESDSSAAYRISNPVSADKDLHQLISDDLRSSIHELEVEVAHNVLNASADSFYSSQGRQTSFRDHNSGLIDRLLKDVPDIATLEMETFHLFHLAACWRPPTSPVDTPPEAPPVPDRPLNLTLTNGSKSTNPSDLAVTSIEGSRIRAASVHMVFAQRDSRDFISPEQVHKTEMWVSRRILECLAKVDIPENRMHELAGSVWEI
ncbi:purine and uridine phosphorylase [Sistotremastrum suecicum HHB10207 ss-3]|uniref:Purine and uridine phosphorylase n=1 Tax=Sistotremastrum suecicum HHB10207 ss-3 TaxID=1314776 RepID=A0A166HC24_9AGAM|nr:purine and uridine phosphorylase [Sistotremastrum suecicum HHB10207 ss-3]